MGFFSRKKTSKTVAKDRLKLVLIHDRVNCSTDVLEMMRADIIKTISKYMDIDEGELDVTVGSTRSESSGNVIPALYANIPITNLKKPKE